MIRIGNVWHYEPTKGDIGFMQSRQMLFAKGIDAKGLRRDEVTQLILKHYGDAPIPVPSHILINVRSSPDLHPLPVEKGAPT